MFTTGVIVAFPTDTSYGLGVRADDEAGLQALYALKKRPAHKYCSLMVKDWAMLEQFAEVPLALPKDFFTAKPRTVILKPKPALPRSEFWPEAGVAFRVAPLPAVAAMIDYPVSATSANLTDEPPIYDPALIKAQWPAEVLLFEPSPMLAATVPPSEIWDYTDPLNPQQLR